MRARKVRGTFSHCLTSDASRPIHIHSYRKQAAPSHPNAPQSGSGTSPTACVRHCARRPRRRILSSAFAGHGIDGGRSTRSVVRSSNRASHHAEREKTREREARGGETHAALSCQGLDELNGRAPATLKAKQAAATRSPPRRARFARTIIPRRARRPHRPRGRRRPCGPWRARTLRTHLRRTRQITRAG